MSRETGPALFRRVKDGLYPSNTDGWRLLRSLPQFKEVQVGIKHQRNLERLKAYWAYLHDVIEATGCAPSAEVLHMDIKMGLKFVDGIVCKGGAVRFMPSSISLPAMGEAEFIEFFEAAKWYIAVEFGFGEVTGPEPKLIGSNLKGIT